MKNKKTIVVLLITLVLVALMLGVIFGKDTILFPKSLKATMTVDQPTLAPVGKLSGEEFNKIKEEKIKKVNETENKSIITVTYSNNSNVVLENVRIRFKEVKTTDPTNFVVFAGSGIHSYDRGTAGNTFFNTSFIKPGDTKKAQIIIMAQYAGSSTFEAEVISGDLTSDTKNVTINAK
jgi:hypothetical protein